MTHAFSARPAAPAGFGCNRNANKSRVTSHLSKSRVAARPAATPRDVFVNATGSAAQPAANGSEGQSTPKIDPINTSESDAPQSVSEEPSKSMLQQVKTFFGGDKMDMQRLKALGLGAVASYGCVSNVTYGTGLSISWITFVRQTGELHALHLAQQLALLVQNALLDS